MPHAEVGLYIMMGIGLAAVAGLRAFLPLCVLAWLAHFQVVELSTAYSWMASEAALWIFSLACVLEIAADKIPVVDNLLDQVADYIKPVAGTLLVGGVITTWDPLFATVFALLAGAPVAHLFHQGKKWTRLASTGATLGLGNPWISLMEDFAGLAGIAAAILVPALAFVVVCFSGYLLYRAGRQVVRWFGGSPLPA